MTTKDPQVRLYFPVSAAHQRGIWFKPTKEKLKIGIQIVFIVSGRLKLAIKSDTKIYPNTYPIIQYIMINISPIDFILDR